MIKEVAVKRYNRIGAEGMTSEAVDGRSNSYELNDFKEYEALLIISLMLEQGQKRKGCIL
ncbi:phi 11 orf36 [Staphylococcus aureus]|uniref:Phi 11 orf36 n=1 Tax=Staphylococcus aureus TaxID=1280 RepID=A0A380E0C9_STAAU|nr:phi 11 orf36 [Staphylococcus aureus]